jgi:DNA repair protein RadC
MNKVSEITYRYKSRVKLDQTPVITGSKDAYPIFWEHWNKDTIEMEEEFYIMLLNYGNRVKGLVKISTGGIKGTVVDAKKIFSLAVKTMSASIILAHNHPSGNINASQSDIDLTRKLMKGGELLDITVLDHLIMTPTFNKYSSFADSGLVF